MKRVSGGLPQPKRPSTGFGEREREMDKKMMPPPPGRGTARERKMSDVGETY